MKEKFFDNKKKTERLKKKSKESLLFQLDKKDTQLIKQIISMIDNREYPNAIELISQHLNQGLDSSNRREGFLKATFAGFLIDIGEEGRIEGPVLEGLKIYQQDYSFFCKLFTEPIVEYNIGNGKDALFKIQRQRPNFMFKPDNLKLLNEAKSHYWKSYKSFGIKNSSLYPQLLVNLANTLDTSGRVVEAIQYYDLVLSKFPDFPKANSCRSQALLFLHRLSNVCSINLLWQAMSGFDKASRSTTEPEWLRIEWEQERDRLKTEIKKHKHGDDSIQHDLSITKKEYKSLSSYRKFCLKNHLTLCEHSLYCNCIGARWDNLTIPFSTITIGGSFVPRMEHILNRLKAEFALARLLFYRYKVKNNWETFNKEVAFTELYEAEIIGVQTEMLRTSFRLCFGILDKIAHGICELFDLADQKENIYFESFWNNKNNDRWEKINTIKNISLLALYSQATDLNIKNGEWGIYKEWRNRLEHKMFILINDSSAKTDPFNVYKSDFRILRVPIKEFEIKTLHLLQLVRSAIFNFVFCVRKEGLKQSNKEGIPITLRPKNFY